MDDRQVLIDALGFHGHRCWASAAGVRIGLAALEALEVSRAGATQLYAAVEIGEKHGAMCFADGIQFTTGCTFGKGNIERTHEGKLAVTVTESATGRAVRVSYRPELQPLIAASPFMKKRRAGVPPTDIPEDEQWELVDLVWNASRDEIMSIGPVSTGPRINTDEHVAFTTCEICGELVAEPYLRVANDTLMCRSCSGYEV
ncbi:MAG: tRNA CCA-pyrophosphorylase [Gammaproteobacteria bacterium]|nr:tRNA CCA-pyrophosphorylase [Gammaproteobacteria bacterium]